MFILEMDPGSLWSFVRNDAQTCVSRYHILLDDIHSFTLLKKIQQMVFIQFYNEICFSECGWGGGHFLAQMGAVFLPLLNNAHSEVAA